MKRFLGGDIQDRAVPDDRTVRLEFRFGTAQNPADHALVYNPIFTDPVFAAFLRVVNGLFNKAAVFWMNGLEYNSPIGERLLRRHAIDRSMPALA